MPPRAPRWFRWRRVSDQPDLRQAPGVRQAGWATPAEIGHLTDRWADWRLLPGDARSPQACLERGRMDPSAGPPTSGRSRGGPGGSGPGFARAGTERPATDGARAAHV